MQNARRKQRSGRRPLVEPGETGWRTSRKADGDVGVSLANAELHHLLTERGWNEYCRADGRTMYDWPPSAPDKEHEITYLIVDLLGEPGAGPPYRVSVVSGDRLMYEVDSALVADLDTIEATRCPGCTPCPHEAVQ